MDLLLEKLNSKYKVHGPVRKDVEYAFGPVTTAKDLCLDYTTTILPPKKFFTPPRETIFKFHGDKIIGVEEIIPEEKQILLGIHACDMTSFNFLDGFFGL